MGGKKEILINIGIMLLTFLLFFAGVEVYFRFASPQSCYAFPKGIYVEDKELCYKLAPSVIGTTKQPEYTVTYETNSKGLRDKEYEYEKKPGMKRAVALGDSFQFGHGVDKSYTEIAEQKISGVEFINMGIPGYGTSQQIAFLKKEGLKYEPDYIIVSFYTEDLFDNLQTRCIRYVRDGYLVDNVTAAEQGAGFRMKLFLNQNFHSYCFAKNAYVRGAQARFTGRVGVEGTAVEAMQAQQSPQILKAWAKTSIYLSSLSETAKFNNATLVVVSIPHQVQVDDNIWAGVKGGYGLNETDYYSNLPGLKLRDLSEKLGAKFIDLYPGLKEQNKKEKLYYPVDGHLTQRGQEVAEEIFVKEFMGPND